MKANKFLCFILFIALMLGLFSGCASAQKDEISTAEEGGLSQIAETISLDGLDKASVEYAAAWFRVMVPELSEPEEELVYENKYRWSMYSENINVAIEPEDNAPECMYRIGIMNNQASVLDENAQQFKDLCLAAVAHYMNDDVAAQIAEFFDIGPTSDGAYTYEGNDNIESVYYPDENSCLLSYKSDSGETVFHAGLKMDTGVVSSVWFTPSALVPEAPQSGLLLWDDFLKLLEARFPSYEMDVSPFTDNETSVYLTSGGTQLAQIMVWVRPLDNALLHIIILPQGNIDSEDTVNMICAVCTICDNTITEENVQFIFQYYRDNFYGTLVKWPVDSENQHVTTEIYMREDGTLSCAVTFCPDPLGMDGNFFVDYGFLEVPSVADGRFTFMPGNMEEDTVYLDENLPKLLNSYFENSNNPLRVIHYQDFGYGTGDKIYLYHCIDYEGNGWFPVNFEAENGIDSSFTPDGWLCYQVFASKYLSSDAEDAAPYDFQVVTDLLIALSQLCDDGMTGSEAQALFANQCDPTIADNGLMTTIYAPREVVHIWQEDPATGEVAYSVLTKKCFEELSQIDLSQFWQGALEFSFDLSE